MRVRVCASVCKREGVKAERELCEGRKGDTEKRERGRRIVSQICTRCNNTPT